MVGQNKKTRVAYSRAKQIKKRAEEIHAQQLDVDTPPAEMEDVVKLLRSMALEINRLASEIKELKKNVK